jgi:hypothetical protein
VRGAGIRTDRHTKAIGDQVRCLDTGETGTIWAYDFNGDYMIDVGGGAYLRQLDDTELV